MVFSSTGLSFAASHGGIIRRLWIEYASFHWKSYAVAFALGGVAAACTAMTAYLAGHLIDKAYLDRDVTAILLVSSAVVGIFTVKGFASYGRAILVARVNNQITAETQKRLFDKIVQEALGYFADKHSSDFIAKIVYAAGSPAAVLNTLINSLGRDIPTLIGLLTVMLLQAPALSLASFLVAPPAIIIVQRLVKQARELTSDQYSSSAAMLVAAQETIQGLRVIKSFNLENAMRQRVGERIDAIRATSNEMAQVVNRPGPMMEVFGGIAVAIVFAYGGYQVIVVGAKPGDFFSFATAFLLAYEPAKRISRLHLSLSGSLYGVELLLRTLDAKPTEPVELDKPSLKVKSGEIKFDRVSFAYREHEPVLQNLTFVAPPGRITALVGPSGGGKSTIFNLLLRLYEIDRGLISIDGHNIVDVSRGSVRESISYIGQDVFMFNGTIRENIAAGRSDAAQEEIISAAKAAYAHHFIMEFPRGYDTPVGELGTQLSTGQRQRIAIARALLKNAPLILLDEPTSALDAASERQVSDAITTLCSGRTTLVIAHRLHTVTHADCIHVVESGAIVESGSHAILIASGGRYAQLFDLQFAGRRGRSFEDERIL
jgi:ATP-binding cassette subfamily B protein